MGVIGTDRESSEAEDLICSEYHSDQSMMDSLERIPKSELVLTIPHRNYKTGTMMNRRPKNAPSQILPFLFLGNKWDACDEAFLRSNRIGFILNISRDVGTKVTLPQSHQIEIKHIYVRDDPEQDILCHFADAFHFINRSKHAYHNQLSIASECAYPNILVHCVHGISRSPTIVIAYLMREEDRTLCTALEYVRSKRGIISPNLGFLWQLTEYEQWLLWEQMSI
jgi:dual specificity MAP kinase phosphatase